MASRSGPAAAVRAPAATRSWAGLLLLGLWLAVACGSAGGAAPAPAASAPLAAQVSNEAAVSTIEVFVREGCPHCATAEEFLAGLGRERPELRIVIRDVAAEPAALERLQELARLHGGGNARVPAFWVGGQMIFGYSAEAATDRLIRGALRGQAASAPGAGAAPVEGESCAAREETTCRAEVQAEPATLEVFGRTIALDDVGLPVFTIAMGLLDGLNPCSMWVLILMISLLAALRDRRRMVVIAGTFVAIQGLAYFAFMAAWLNFFLWIGLAQASQRVIAAVAIVAGLVHVKDFWRPGAGPSLSIPEQRKPGIYARLRAILNAQNLPAAIAGVVLLALLVQVVEFLCTSGLPALYTRILTLRELGTASYHGYLLLYNAAYLLDDIVVLAIGVATLSQRRLQQREGRWLQLLSGLVMIALGVYLVAA